MNVEILKIVVGCAGIGGLALIAFVILCRDIIRKSIFSQIPPQDAYRLLRLIIAANSLVAIIGIVTWVKLSAASPPPSSLPLAASSPVGSSSSVDAPSPGLLTGVWTGELTQWGSPSRVFKFKLDVKTHEGNMLKGTSRTEWDQHYVVMSFDAILSGNSMRYEETGLLDDNSSDRGVCIKTGQFMFSNDGKEMEMSGKWISRNCGASGHITLKR